MLGKPSNIGSQPSCGTHQHFSRLCPASYQRTQVWKSRRDRNRQNWRTKDCGECLHDSWQELGERSTFLESWSEEIRQGFRVGGQTWSGLFRVRLCSNLRRSNSVDQTGKVFDHWGSEPPKVGGNLPAGSNPLIWTQRSFAPDPWVDTRCSEQIRRFWCARITDFGRPFRGSRKTRDGLPDKWV